MVNRIIYYILHDNDVISVDAIDAIGRALEKKLEFWDGLAQSCTIVTNY